MGKPSATIIVEQGAKAIESAAKPVSLSARIKQILGYLFAIFLIKWFMPAIEQVNIIANDWIKQYDITNGFIKLIIYLVVIIGELFYIIIQRIVKADYIIGQYAETLKTASFTELILGLGEIAIMLFIVYYAIVGWKLPIIGIDVSIQNFISWFFFQGHRSKDTLLASIAVVIVLWEAYSLHLGQGVIMPFSGLLTFAKSFLAHPDAYLGSAKNITNIINATNSTI
jgi:hypothetical protein